MIPLIGQQQPQVPPTVLNGGSFEDRVWLQFGPVGVISIEEAEQMVAGLTRAIAQARQARAAMLAAVQANGVSK